jgi:hypothetical protein
MSAGMTLFLELKFEPFALSIALFVIGLLCAFSGVWLINSLPQEEGEGGSKGVGKVQDSGERGAVEGWDGKPAIVEAVANDDVEMAQGAATTRTTMPPNKSAAWEGAEDTGVLTSDQKLTVGKEMEDTDSSIRSKRRRGLVILKPLPPPVVPALEEHVTQPQVLRDGASGMVDKDDGKGSKRVPSSG